LLNKLGAIVSTPRLAMKFPAERGGVTIVYADQRMAQECYVANLKLTPTVTKPKRDVEEWQLGADGQNTQVGRCLTKEENEKLRKKLKNNRDLFAWTVEDMPSIDP